MSPDLRRAVIFWEPARVDHIETTIAISKKKIKAVQNKLERSEKWVRVQVTKHLNLKVFFCIFFFINIYLLM